MMRCIRNRSAQTALGILVLFAAGTATAENEWRRFRGPFGDGRVVESAAPLHWDDQRGIVWKTALPGPGASSPIVVGDRVFLTCYSGYGLEPDAGDPNQLVRHALCYELATGKLLWDHAVPNRRRETKYSGPYITLHGYASSTPVTDGERVYFFFGSSGVVALTLEGENVWDADVGAGVQDWGAGASPILFEELLLVNAGIESDSLIALDRRTGAKVWSTSGMPRAWNTPLLIDFADGPTELVVSVRGRIRGLDAATGAELWSAAGINAAELCPSPVEHAGVVFILGSPRGEGMAVRAGGRGDVTDSNTLWRLNKGSNVTSPVHYEGRLYWMSDKQGIAYCVEADTGKIVYEERLAPRPGRVYASPVLVGDRIYYVSCNSGTFVVAADPEFRLLAHNVLADDPGPFNGSPAVVAGKLLLRSDRFLYCIGE